MWKIASLLFVVLLAGCSHCTTVAYRAGTDAEDASGQPVGYSVHVSPGLVWAALPMQQLVAVGGVVPADAPSELRRMVVQGTSFKDFQKPGSARNYYSELLSRSSVAAWRPSEPQIEELVEIEGILLRQPNFFQCIGIVLCKKPFPRKLSEEFSGYQIQRAQTAAAADALSKCESGKKDCASERALWTKLDQAWRDEPMRKVVESALARYERITTQDPEVRKIAALDRLGVSDDVAPPLPDSTSEMIQWIESAKSVGGSSDLPAGTVFPPNYFAIDVSPPWFDYDFVSLGSIRVPPEQRPYLATKPILIPRRVILSIELSQSGVRLASIVGVLGNVVTIETTNTNNRSVIANMNLRAMPTASAGGLSE